MSREDQINAELASQISPEQQKTALVMKRPIGDDDRLSILTDDEAIITVGRVYADFVKSQKTSEYVATGIGIGAMFFSILGQNWGPLMIGVPIAFGYYYLTWGRKKDEIALELYNALHRQAGFKKSRLESGSSNKVPTASTNTSTFDVPPQNG